MGCASLAQRPLGQRPTATSGHSSGHGLVDAHRCRAERAGVSKVAVYSCPAAMGWHRGRRNQPVGLAASALAMPSAGAPPGELNDAPSGLLLLAGFPAAAAGTATAGIGRSGDDSPAERLRAKGRTTQCGHCLESRCQLVAALALSVPLLRCSVPEGLSMMPMLLCSGWSCVKSADWLVSLATGSSQRYAAMRRSRMHCRPPSWCGLCSSGTVLSVLGSRSRVAHSESLPP